jgi:hypothetical protein
MIVSIYNAGLGNRLKSWVSAMRLDNDARVYWEVNRFMPVGFSHLFTNDCGVEEIPADARVYDSWRLALMPDDRAQLPAGFSTAGAGAHPLIRGLGKAWWNLRGRPTDRYRYMVFPKMYKKSGTRPDARYIDLEYERIPGYFRELYCPLFQKIQVQPALLRQAKEWAAMHLDKKIIGVQVRTWRDAARRHKKYHKSSMKRLARLMDKAGPGARFLVVSDSDDIIPFFKEKYGAGIILHFPRETRRHESWQTPAGIGEDLIDMLLLARCGRIYASYLSTFSEVAWWLGGASARVWVY